jgi:CHAD domain-containing protein
MPYRLDFSEDLPTSLRRTAREQLDDALARLRDQHADDPVEAVHGARKDLKKARSLLRLARPSLDRAAYRRIDDELRDAGRRLSDRRDADALTATVDDLAERYVGRLPEQRFAELRAQVTGAGAGGAAPAPPDDVLATLRAAADAVPGWPLERLDADALRDGAVRAYGRGRDAMAAAVAEPTDERLHEWRKRAKDLWYQARLLEDAWPRAFKALAQDAHALADLLGDDHDLAVLSGHLTAAGGAGTAEGGDDDVLELVAHRRHELQDTARRLGARLYAEKPAAFRRRLARYLAAVQDERRGPQAA